MCTSAPPICYKSRGLAATPSPMAQGGGDRATQGRRGCRSIYSKVVGTREPHHGISLVGSGDPIIHMWIRFGSMRPSRYIWGLKVAKNFLLPRPDLAAPAVYHLRLAVTHCCRTINIWPCTHYMDGRLGIPWGSTALGSKDGGYDMLSQSAPREPVPVTNMQVTSLALQSA